MKQIAIYLILSSMIAPTLCMEKVSLTDAIKTNNVEAVQRILKSNIYTREQLELYLFECGNDASIALLLLQAGASANCKLFLDYGRTYTTPLFKAVPRGAAKLTAILLAHGANVDEIIDGCTPLNLAILAAQRNEQDDVHDYAGTIQALIRGKANLERDLWVATFNRNPEVCKQLISFGADPYQKNAQGKNAFDALKESGWGSCLEKETRLVLLGQDTLYGKAKAILSCCCGAKKKRA